MTRTDDARDAGFALIELLVAMTLSLIVLFATLQTLDAFTSNTARQTRQTDANDRARSTMDRVVDDLRGAAVIRTASATDLVYSVAQLGGTTRTDRLCVAPGSPTASLFRSTSTTSTAPGTACGTTGAGWTQGRVASLPGTTTTAFTYDGATSSATPSTVRTVGLTFNVDASGGGRTDASTLRASVTLRRVAGSLPVDGDDLRVNCNTPGGGALLSLALGAAGNLGAGGGPGSLAVVYKTSGGITLGGGTAGSAPIQIPAGVTNVIATVTDALGVTNTIQKTVNCA